MAIKIPATWSSTSAYSVGDTAYLNGVIYECIVAVAANANGNDDPVDNTSWKVRSVIRIEDYYSLQEAIEEGLNTQDEFVMDSIPVFIQNVEVQLAKLLQAPAQKIIRVYTLDSDSKFEIPSDLLTIHHLRKNDSDGAGFDLESRGSIEIESAQSRADFEELDQNYGDNGFWNNGGFEFPVYRTDDQYIYIAPKYDSGTEVELTYLQEVPSLGTTVNLVRVEDGVEVPVNSDDQDVDEWIAADPANNNADNFVQATETVTTNLWTSMVPHILKAGALAEGFKYLKNTESSQMWEQQFQTLMKETQIQIDNFKTDRTMSPNQLSAY